MIYYYKIVYELGFLLLGQVFFFLNLNFGFSFNIWNSSDLLQFNHEVIVLTRDSFYQMWGGIILVNTGNHSVWVDFTVPLIILIELLNLEFI